MLPSIRALSQRFRSSRTLAVAGTAAAALTATTNAYAHDPVYVDELEILSGEALLTKKLGSAVVSGAQSGANALLTDLGKGLLSGLLDSYVPGLSSLLGFGGDDAGTQQILNAVRSSTVQLSDRIRELQDEVEANKATEILSYYQTGAAEFEQHQALSTLNRKLANHGLLLENANDNLLFAMNLIENNLFNSSNRLQAIEHLQTHIIVSTLLGSVAAERGRLAAITDAMDAANWSGNADDFMLSLPSDRQEELSASVHAAIQQQMEVTLDGVAASVFDFYQRVGYEGVLRDEVESWFSPLTHPTMCWNSSLDGSFDRPGYYQDTANWDNPCCTMSQVWGHHKCDGYADIFWYYFVKAPNAECYRSGDRLFEEELAEDCNLFFVRNTSAGVWKASYDGYLWPAHDPDYDGYEDHKDAAYVSFVAREYAPISIYLDVLWASLGRSGSRPLNQLDRDLDFEITSVPGLPERDPRFGLPKNIDFMRFPSWSTANFMSVVSP